MDKYLDSLKSIVLNYVADAPIKVYLIGSRAKRTTKIFPKGHYMKRIKERLHQIEQWI